MTPKKYFGTDGIRGRVNGPIINVDTMTRLGWAIASVLKNELLASRVLIGRDTRESGEMLETALMNGLLSAGVSVCLLGILSTPAIAFLTKKMHAAAGIVISASHNSYEDNGIKIIDSDGFKLSDEWEIKIEQKIAEYNDSMRVSIGAFEKITNAATPYIKHCLQLFPALPLTHKKIIVDCANGATFECAPKILSALGAEVVTIHASPDGKNINEKCGATDVKSLQARVIVEKADCGIAFDGDGDRLMMVDECGDVVDGDEILAILATDETKKYHAVVGTFMSNLGLEKLLQSRGIQFERAAVGDRYVLEKLLKNNWQLGGEGSGHIVNLHYATTGDGVLTALQVLRIMQRTQKSLHALKQVMKKRPQVLLNVKVKDPARFAIISEISQAVRDAEKKLNGLGRVLLRASGTESCVRVMVECDEVQQAHTLVQSLAQVVERCFSQV